jgi:hypothetical protein
MRMSFSSTKGDESLSGQELYCRVRTPRPAPEGQAIFDPVDYECIRPAAGHSPREWDSDWE